ncbi:MAG TPA: hypothetical protein VG944_12655 [Fimbriimonas sp.]|nr:hypothetical protein [Fimbriimonas sp.]
MPTAYDSGASDVWWAIGRSVLAIVFLFVFKFVGLITAAYGLMYAIRAQQKGHKHGIVAIAISVVTLIIVGIVFLFRTNSPY